MKENRSKNLYVLAIIIGWLLLVWEIVLYRRTIIALTGPLSILILASLLTFVIIKNRYNRVHRTTGCFYPFMQSIFSFGFTSCFLFMALNYYFADRSGEKIEYKIISKTSMGTKYPIPAAMIEINSMEKQLVFYSSEEQQVKKAKSVILNVRRGFLGYDIWDEISLKE